MIWLINWLWLKFCVAMHTDGERQVDWAIPRVKAALQRDEKLRRRGL
jgi:hypothetical protein